MPESDSSYFLDANMVEASRLINQDRMVTEAVSLLPPHIEGATLRNVLDIGCGPGGWLLELKETYPQVAGIGIDDKDNILFIAELYRKAERADLTFLKADARKPLPFDDASFDYVHIRLAMSFLLAPMWEATLQECFRILESGGALCISDLEGVFSQKSAAEELYGIHSAAFHRMNWSFSSSGRTIGMIPALKALLKKVGFIDQRIQLHYLDVSYGEPYYESSLESHKIIHRGLEPLLIQKAGYSPEYLSSIFERGMQEMREPDFVGYAMLFTNCSKKP